MSRRGRAPAIIVGSCRQVARILDLEVGGEHAVFPHPCKDVAEALLGARGARSGLK